MSAVTKDSVLRYIAGIEASIRDQYGKPITPRWIFGPFEPGVAVDEERMMGHALFALERAKYIVQKGNMDDPSDRSGVALCIGVACAAALAYGVTAHERSGIFSIYPAINLPSVITRQ